MATPSLYSFINYIWPFWYFNLSSQNQDTPFWIDYHQLTEEEKTLISYDTSYSHPSISLQDAAYQAFTLGIVKVNKDFSLQDEEIKSKATVYDCYKFIRKYFKAIWLPYVLFQRILRLENPLIEIRALVAASKVDKVSFPNFDNTSSFKAKQPVVNGSNISVILPTLERYELLKDTFLDLTHQNLKIKEVIVVDQTSDPDVEFYNDFTQLPLKVLYQNKKGQWTARNLAIREATADFLLFLDDDSRFENDLVQHHINALHFFNVDISAGISLLNNEEFLPPKYRNFIWSDRLDSGNVMIRKEVFQKIGLFDLQFDGQRMGDGEFGLRAYLNGFKIISNPLAVRNHLLASYGGLRSAGYWTSFKPINFFKIRPIPSVIYLLRRYFPQSNLISYLLINIPLSFIPQKNEKSSTNFFIGTLIFIVALPLTIINLRKSFKRSSKMLQKGPKIKKLS